MHTTYTAYKTRTPFDIHTCPDLNAVTVRTINPWDEQRRGMVKTEPETVSAVSDSTDAGELFERIDREAQPSEGENFDHIQNQEVVSLKWTITSILKQIAERHTLRDRNIREIETKSSELSSQIARIRQIFFTPERIREAAQQKTWLQRELVSLQKQLNWESVAAWKDVSRLKESLMEHVGELLALQSERTLTDEVTQHGSER